MTRTIPSDIAADFTAGASTLSRCVRLDLRDGTSVGITDHDADLDVDLGDGSITYVAGTGAIPSAIKLSVGLDADNLEVRGPLTALITRAAVLGGRYDRAEVRVFDADWNSPTSYLRLLKGNVSQSRVEGGEFVFEIRSKADFFNQSIGRVLSPYCTHDFGLGQCQATPETFTATVSAVTSDLEFTVSPDSPAPTADDIRGGLCTFLTGDLAGTLPVEIFEYAAGVVTLYAPLAELPTIGDTLRLTEGCEKTRTACKLKGQILNFGGFPDLSGTDDYLKYPVPGT